MNGKEPSFEIVNGTEIFDNLYRTILYCTGSPDNNWLDSRFGAAVCFYCILKPADSPRVTRSFSDES